MIGFFPKTLTLIPHCYFVVQEAISYLGEALLAGLAGERVPAFNVHAVSRLRKDIAALTAFADGLGIPFLGVCF